TAGSLPGEILLSAQEGGAPDARVPPPPRGDAVGASAVVQGEPTALRSRVPRTYVPGPRLRVGNVPAGLAALLDEESPLETCGLEQADLLGEVLVGDEDPSREVPLVGEPRPQGVEEQPVGPRGETRRAHPEVDGGVDVLPGLPGQGSDAGAVEHPRVGRHEVDAAEAGPIRWVEHRVGERLAPRVAQLEPREVRAVLLDREVLRRPRGR